MILFGFPEVVRCVEETTATFDAEVLQGDNQANAEGMTIFRVYVYPTT